jgi:hypothetical protein
MFRHFRTTAASSQQTAAQGGRASRIGRQQQPALPAVPGPEIGPAAPADAPSPLVTTSCAPTTISAAAAGSSPTSMNGVWHPNSLAPSTAAHRPPSFPLSELAGGDASKGQRRTKWVAGRIQVAQAREGGAWKNRVWACGLGITCGGVFGNPI